MVVSLRLTLFWLPFLSWRLCDQELIRILCCASFWLLRQEGMLVKVLVISTAIVEEKHNRLLVWWEVSDTIHASSLTTIKHFLMLLYWRKTWFCEDILIINRTRTRELSRARLLIHLNWEVVKPRFKCWIFAARRVWSASFFQCLGIRTDPLLVTLLCPVVILLLELCLEIILTRILELVGEHLIRKTWTILTRRLESLCRSLAFTIIMRATFPAGVACELRTTLVVLTCTAEDVLRFGELLTQLCYCQAHVNLLRKRMFRWLKLTKLRLCSWFYKLFIFFIRLTQFLSNEGRSLETRPSIATCVTLPCHSEGLVWCIAHLIPLPLVRLQI